MANTTKKPVGRPAIPAASIILDTNVPLNGQTSFRMDAGDKSAKTNLAQTVYLNRAALVAAGLPEGHVPQKVEVTVRVLKSAPAPAAE